MRKIVIGFGAHPDDEVLFAGKMMKEKAEGSETNLVVITDGQAGVNPDNVSNLGATRLEEWRTSAATIGADTLEPLHYEDGQLSNERIEELINDICKVVLGRLAMVNTDATVSFITFDEDGLTGHRDHLSVTSAVIQAFKRLQVNLPQNITLDELLLYRLTKEQANLGPGTDEYPLTGYSQDEIDLQVDVTDFVQQKKLAMQKHESQKSDMDAWISLGDTQLAIECFRVMSKVTTDQES